MSTFEKYIVDLPSRHVRDVLLLHRLPRHTKKKDLTKQQLKNLGEWRQLETVQEAETVIFEVDRDPNKSEAC